MMPIQLPSRIRHFVCRHFAYRSFAFVVIFLCVAAAFSGVIDQHAMADDPIDAERVPTLTTDQLVRELIEKLGSDSYATRIRARNQLKMYGLEAFDALREAQTHDDSEILSAARYLISSLQVSWSKDTDPKEVQEILSEYGAQNETERLGRIELLGRLQNQMGIEALARLARFDPSVPLSRRAAMLVLKQPLGREKVGRQQLAERIQTIVGENPRDSSQWLLAYADDLREGRYASQRWSDLVREQRRGVDAGIDVSVTSASVMEMIRVLASRALGENSQDAALALVMDHLDLIAPATRDLAEHSAWSIRQGLYPVVVSLYERHKHTFGENAELLYSAAQAYDETGQSELAERLASAALQVNPLPEHADQDPAPQNPPQPAEKPANAVSDHQLQEIAYAHYQVALMLQTRGRFEWSEREHSAIIDRCDIESIVGVSSRQQLARMYSDQLRHDAAAAAVFPIADRAEKDQLYHSRMSRWQFSLSRIRSLYQYESALAMLDKNGPDRATLDEVKSKLQLAYRFDTDNIDILIRMYRLEDAQDPEWKTAVTQQILQNRDELQQRISRIESRKKIIKPEDYKLELGEAYNQYAWLVANTEGDFERALKCSLDSIDFLDDDDISSLAARLDTCARCYFALDRIDDAIATQQRAIQLDPYSPPMARQLKQFQDIR